MRRQNDNYPTPEWATKQLISNLSWGCLEDRTVFEPCAGSGAIANVLKAEGAEVITNDYDKSYNCDYHFNAGDMGDWRQLNDKKIDWIITNPPFNMAVDILRIALGRQVTGVAMLLRLSFLEPVNERAMLLSTFPPSKLVVLPRISFTGDGKTDSVTCAWMIWVKHTSLQTIRVVPR